MQTTHSTPRSLHMDLFYQQATIYEVKEVKPYSGKELSHIYGISVKTFMKWITPFRKEIGEKKGRFYTVLQVEIIFARLGLPYKFQDQSKVN